MSDLHFMTASEAAALFRSGKLSPVELTRAYLDRIEALDHLIDSYITVTVERAMADAGRAEREIAAGLDRGPMHGIPYCLKDIVETEGILTTGQSRSLAQHIPTKDATLEARLRAGGAVLLGKTTTWEFAHGGPSWDVVAPPARNPWNRENHPAGSSSGTGAAIAAGMAATGIGTDTGGSIRLPAAVCGIAGLKPTYGRVSRTGVLPNSFTHDHAGPMAWTSQDVAMMLAVIAGHDPLDPGSGEVPVAGDLAQLDERVLSGLTIGVPYRWFEEEAPSSAEVREAFDAALAAMVDAGARVVPVELPSLESYADAKKTIAMAELYSIHHKTLKETPHLLGESLRYRIQCGALIRAEDYVQAMRWRTQLSRVTQAVFDTVDILAMPTAEPAGRLEATPHSWLFKHKSLTTPFNTTGNPALSVCNGFSKAGMPLSLQLVGKPFDDRLVLSVGSAYEQITPWRAKRPVLAGAEPASSAA